MSNIRNSAKAIIIRNRYLLTTRNIDDEGDWYLLPGGGQRHGENLHDTLRRECMEEVSAEIKIGELKLIREYIGTNHEFAHEDSQLHQVEFMFECEIDNDCRPSKGNEPDPRQKGVSWLKLDKLHEYRLYPSILHKLLKDGLDKARHIYLGDIN